MSTFGPGAGEPGPERPYGAGEPGPERPYGAGEPGPVLPEVDVDQLAQAMTGGAPLIDVRQPDEYDAAHVPGARLIALNEVALRVDEVTRDGPVYVICQSGSRSLKAAEFYRARGIDAISVAGGTKAWVDSGRLAARGPDPG